MVPRLENLMRQLQLEATSLRTRIEALAGDGDELQKLALADMVDRYPELKATTTRMAKLAGQIESFGCFLKDIDQGLVDFPGEVEDEVVFLCWQFGEPRVIAWHSIESGFASRKPLPGTPKPYLN